MGKREHWRTLRRDTVFRGGPIQEISLEVVQLPDGRIVPDYHVIRLADYALVYAEMGDGTVPIIRQYKHGLGRVCLTFPGGAVDDGESPLDAARRELLEETGCDAQGWETLGSFVTNANQGCNTAHLFRASNCRRVTEPRSGDLEAMSLLFVDPMSLLEGARLEEIGLLSHVSLLLLATGSSTGFLRP